MSTDDRGANGAKDEVTMLLPMLRADDVIDVGIVHPAEPGGERLIALQIPRLGIGFAMTVGDCALAANTLAVAAQRVLDLNNEDAEKSGSSIIVARH